MKKFLLTTCAALALAACGGGNGDDSALPQITSVIVAGDSLADSGTFGFKFTIQGAAATGVGSTHIWPELVAQSFGAPLCAHYLAAANFAAQAGCRNYAVGGGVINAAMAPLPQQAISYQLQDAATQGFKAGDLLLIDGGGNDAADLISAFLADANSADGSQGQMFIDLLATALDANTLDAALQQGLPQAGAVYMESLAVSLASSIEHHALNQGAQQVAVLNMPPVTATPRLLTVLQSIAQLQGPATAAQLEAMFASWVVAFNTTLSSEVARIEASHSGPSRLVLVDFHEWFVQRINQPAVYGFSNTTTPACPATGVNASGLPSYTLQLCTQTALSAAPPEGDSANWWMRYAFSDDFHPTPEAHQQIGTLVTQTLQQVGWQ